MTNTITCKNCGARNRLKATSGGLTPVCGRCGAPLLATVSAPSTPSPAPAPALPSSNTQTLILIGIVALALTGLAELLLMLLY